MARIALTIASVAAAVAAPFTAGTSLGLEVALAGASVAMSVGASLLRPKVGLAPLQDLNVSSSADGSPIPFGYGTMRFGGQIIWSPGITYNVVNQQSAKGGPTPVGYTYFCSFACAFGEGEATIGRIWADSKLIYNGGQPIGQFNPWDAATNYAIDDYASFEFNPGTGNLTQVYQATLPSLGIPPAGASLYWTVASVVYWQSAISYSPGEIVAYPGLPSEVAQSGVLYAATQPGSGNEPDISPRFWQPLGDYYTAPTIYPGSATQDPDPLIQGQEGVDNTPAFRGICYAVWDNFPLSTFGGRIPNLRAEVTFAL